MRAPITLGQLVPRDELRFSNRRYLFGDEERDAYFVRTVTYGLRVYKPTPAQGHVIFLDLFGHVVENLDMRIRRNDRMGFWQRVTMRWEETSGVSDDLDPDDVRHIVLAILRAERNYLGPFYHKADLFLQYVRFTNDTLRRFESTSDEAVEALEENQNTPLNGNVFAKQHKRDIPWQEPGPNDLQVYPKPGQTGPTKSAQTRHHRARTQRKEAQRTKDEQLAKPQNSETDNLRAQATASDGENKLLNSSDEEFLRELDEEEESEEVEDKDQDHEDNEERRNEPENPEQAEAKAKAEELKANGLKRLEAAVAKVMKEAVASGAAQRAGRANSYQLALALRPTAAGVKRSAETDLQAASKRPATMTLAIHRGRPELETVSVGHSTAPDAREPAITGALPAQADWFAPSAHTQGLQVRDSNSILGLGRDQPAESISRKENAALSEVVREDEEKEQDVPMDLSDSE